MPSPNSSVRRAVVCLCLLVACGSRSSQPLPAFGAVPPFALTDQAGAAFSSTQLDGKIWVANFVFTRCPTVCPTLTARMHRIQDGTNGLGNAVHLVSFTVDPEFDSAARLTEYAERHRAGPRWTFLTGDRATLEAVIQRGLKQAMVRGDGSLMSIAHSNSVVLVDGRGVIRGFYRLSDAASVEAVIRDTSALAAEP